jgi:hypothetical protein
MFSNQQKEGLESLLATGGRNGRREAGRWVARACLVGLGALGGYAGAHWGQMPGNAESQVLNALVLMDKKLDLIWAQGSAAAQATPGAEGAVLELPPISLKGGSVKLRFKRIGERYHYEVFLEGGIDAISRLVAPQGKNALLKATFVDQDHFDLADLTFSGQQFAIQQGEAGKGIALNLQGVWESKVDPATIKAWRLETLEREGVEENLGASPAPTPTAQVQALATEITIQPATGKWVLPEGLQNPSGSLAQTAPAPSPAAPTFHEPPATMPVYRPDAAESPKPNGISPDVQGPPKSGPGLPVQENKLNER